MVMMFLQTFCIGNKEFSGKAGVCAKQVINTELQDTLKTLRSDQIGCWSFGTCAKAEATGPKSGDRFLRGARACNGFLHLLFFLRENP